MNKKTVFTLILLVFIAIASLAIANPFDDAVLSLGGLLAKREEKTIVMTLPIKSTTATTTLWSHVSLEFDRDRENDIALSRYGATPIDLHYSNSEYYKKSTREETVNNLVLYIKAIIEKNKGKKISIYGPATFGNNITHPDHGNLHDALIQIVKIYSNYKNIRYYIYEDFPYIVRFNSKYENNKMGTLYNYLSLKDQMKFTEIHIELSELQLSEKLKGISDYPSQVKDFNEGGFDVLKKEEVFAKNRCKNTESYWYACEVVYEVER